MHNIARQYSLGYLHQFLILRRMLENTSSAMAASMTAPFARTAQSGRGKKIQPAVHKTTDRPSAAELTNCNFFI